MTGGEMTVVAERDESAEAPGSKARNRLEWLAVMVVAVLAATLLKTFLVQAFYIPSGSMEPTLMIGDRVIVSKLSYRMHDVERGDIIVFAKPADAEGTTKDLIKRVIALPGDVIESHDGRVFVNNEGLDEPYVPAGPRGSDIERIKVPSGHLFVLGDNRGASRDSRYIGTIPTSSVVGKAVLRVWPLPDLGLL